MDAQVPRRVRRGCYALHRCFHSINSKEEHPEKLRFPAAPKSLCPLSRVRSPVFIAFELTADR
jgi:hypothetical protein